jgi:hypothetical protein
MRTGPDVWWQSFGEMRIQVMYTLNLYLKVIGQRIGEISTQFKFIIIQKHSTTGIMSMSKRSVVTGPL